MDHKSQTIAKPFGNLTRHKNGLIYFCKNENILIDGREIVQILKSVRELDNSGDARMIIFSGRDTEYTYDAQHLLLKNKILGALAFVVQAEYEPPNLERSEVLSRLYEPKYPIAIFDNIKAAERWHLSAWDLSPSANMATADNK